MKDIQELKEQRSHLLLSANDIANKAKSENRLLTAEESKTTDQLIADADRISDEINQIVANQKQQEKIAAAVENLSQPGRRQTAPSEPSSEPRNSQPQLPMARYGRLKAFRGDNAERNAYEAGCFIVAKLFPTEHPVKAKAHRWCAENGTYVAIQNALSTGVPASGGALVPDAMSQTIIDLREQYGILRQWAEVMPMSSDHQIIPRRSGSVSPSWTAEGVAITASDPSFNNVTMTAKKLAALTRISTELSEDAIIAIGDWVTMDIAQQFAYEEDRVGFNGTGASTDGGIRGLMDKVTDSAYSASYKDVATSSHNTFAELDATDLVTLMAACPQYARNGAAWFCSQVCADLVFGRLKAAGGGNTLETLAMAGITALGQRGVVGSYLGYPIVASQVLPSSTGALTSVPMLAFGNLSKAILIGERRAISFATDSSIYFAEDQVAVKATARMDVNVHSLGDTSTAGPVVVLKGGSS